MTQLVGNLLQQNGHATGYPFSVFADWCRAAGNVPTRLGLRHLGDVRSSGIVPAELAEEWAGELSVTVDDIWPRDIPRGAGTAGIPRAPANGRPTSEVTEVTGNPDLGKPRGAARANPVQQCTTAIVSLWERWQVENGHWSRIGQYDRSGIGVSAELAKNWSWLKAQLNALELQHGFATFGQAMAGLVVSSLADTEMEIDLNEGERQ